MRLGELSGEGGVCKLSCFYGALCPVVCMYLLFVYLCDFSLISRRYGRIWDILLVKGETRGERGRGGGM